MAILYFILALFACIASGVGGAYAMRFVTERNREIAEQEDPRDTKIRDLQAKVRLTDKDMVQNRAKSESATEHLKLAHDRINELLDEIQDLKNSLQNQESVQDTDSEEKDLLRNKLSVATKQLETLRQNNQELEVQLSVIHEPDLLTTQEEDSETEEDKTDPFEPAVADNSPSLIHALTGELDRWKRHCHVLGDELKNQRHRTTESDEESAAAATTIPEIDELTDIHGIGAVLTRKLHTLGIYRYEDLLNLDGDNLEHARQLIPDFERRMERDGWLEQARMLHTSKYRPDVEQAEYAALT